jgi:hypothetical protein
MARRIQEEDLQAIEEAVRARPKPSADRWCTVRMHPLLAAQTSGRGIFAEAARNESSISSSTVRGGLRSSWA